MSKKHNITGVRFDRLVVLREGPFSKHSTLWVCRCDCGSEKTVAARDLKSGHTRSCGCLARDVHANRLRTHGMYRAPERVVWSLMLARCRNPKCKEYKYYGARGVTVCDRWVESFKSFIEDMGRRPSAKHSIDRIDVNGDYEPGNCRWATDIEQARNKRPQERSASGVSGVTRTRGGWMARIGVNGENFFLGTYPDVRDAIEARKRGERQYWV